MPQNSLFNRLLILFVTVLVVSKLLFFALWYTRALLAYVGTTMTQTSTQLSTTTK